MVIQFFLGKGNDHRHNFLLIVRLDAIGDYLLFRNFISSLIESDKYKGKHVTLVGNLAWKSLALELDSEFVDEFIWIDRKKFVHNYWYRYRKLKQITANGYETVVSSVFSREFFHADWVVRAANAKNKIGSAGDCSNMTPRQKTISDAWFTELMPVRDGVLFEFYRNREFFENLLDKKIALAQPTINYVGQQKKFNLSKKYAVLFIGASASYRKWPIESFAATARQLSGCYGYDIVLCGGAEDTGFVSDFSMSFNDEFVDQVGKTSLVDMMSILSGASILVSNETSIPHFAVALGLQEVVVIYNGAHFGRFVPYPERMTQSYHVIYHPEMQKNKGDYMETSDRYEKRENLDISRISVDTVASKIIEIMA